MSEEGITKVGVELLRYLAAHPEAQDDLEGLVRFWLLERRLTETRAEVKQALDDLVARGLVESVEGPDGRVRFRRAGSEG